MEYTRKGRRWKGNNPAKVFLGRYHALAVQLESIRRETERIRESVTSITAPLKPDVVKTSGSGDRIADAVAMIADAETQFAEILDEATNARREIIEAIKSVDSETEKAVLMLRYIEGLDWVTIADKIGYSDRQTYVIHGKALVCINQWINRKGN